MKAFATDAYPLPLPPTHSFPLAKYAGLRRRVLDEGIIAPDDLLDPEAATDGQILRAHSPEYLRKVVSGDLSVDEARALGLPWSPELVERSRRTCGATIGAARIALAEGVAASLAGGTHHAFRDRGNGYCVFNDVAVAARDLQADGSIRRALIVDCDVHQGDGTASIFADDPTVFTFSIHGAKNYPLRKQVGARAVEVDDGATDGPYLDALDRGLRAALDRSGPGVDLAFYLAGSDPFEGDRLGRLKLTKAGLAERDRRVFAALRGAGLPVAMAMAGGYAKDVADTIEIQAETVRIAARCAESSERPR